MDMNNLTPLEEEFRKALATRKMEGGTQEEIVPTTENELKAKFQEMADQANLPIANPSKYSAFWVFCKAVAIGPALWLIAFMVRRAMPNMFVKTASGQWLDLLAGEYNVIRKPAVKACGKLTFSRVNASQVLAIPAGTPVRTIPINGKIYRMRTLELAEMPVGVSSMRIPCEAEEAGGAYNLGAGYYSLMDSDVPGLTEVTNAADYLTKIGADTESDEELKLRIRNQFAAAGDWHTDAKYKSLISSRAGFRPDRIYILRYDEDHYKCEEGRGSAHAFILFDADADYTSTIADLNEYISVEGNHGHGDELVIKDLPKIICDISAVIFFRPETSPERRQKIMEDLTGMICCAFRLNQAYVDKVTQTWAYSRFSISKLSGELHAMFPEILSIDFAQEDIVTELAVARLGNLTLTEGI